MKGVTFVAFAGAAGTALLAQVADHLPPELGSLSATAILGWYAWHTASKTVPNLVRDFRAELADARDESRDERRAFFEQLAAERQMHHEDSWMISDALRDVAARLPPPEPGGAVRAAAFANKAHDSHETGDDRCPT